MRLSPKPCRPFYVGRAKTSAGHTKKFAAQDGATWFYLGVVDDARGKRTKPGGVVVRVTYSSQ